MEDKFVNHLKNKKIYILSPHFDDAILSMGMLMYKLKDYNNITVINCFTKAHRGPHTLSTKQFLKLSGYTDAEKLYNDRSVEDKGALSFLNVKYINLDLAEALFRRKPKKTILGKVIPELDHLYPTYRWHITKSFNLHDKAPATIFPWNILHALNRERNPAEAKISSYSSAGLNKRFFAKEDEALKNLKIKIAELIPDNSVVFSPLGIGGHIDHLITYRVGKELFKDVFYYVDFPYYVRLNNLGKPPRDYQRYDLEIDLSLKTRLIGFYRSQVSGLFPGGTVPKHREHYYLPLQSLTQ